MVQINIAMQSDGSLKPREERLEMQRLFERERDLLIDIIKSGEATEYEYDQFRSVDSNVVQLERINACEYDVARFATEYFSDDGNPDNDENLIPKGNTYENMSAFHKEFCEMLSSIAKKEVKDHIAWACPRQHAKTAYGTNIFPLHQIVFKHRKFIIVVSETVTVAGTFIQWGNRQLKFNQKLIDDYGMLLHERASSNEIDNKEEYITLNGVKVMARGAGGQIRGMRYGNVRPELIIFDDLESDEDVRTKDSREKLRQWFNEEALPAMSKENGKALYVGTILGFESLLDEVIRKDRRFRSRRYKAIESFASDRQLWDMWRDIYTSDDPEASDKARQFYDEHEEEMLKGVKLLWGEFWTYYEFMELLINMGVKSFTQEYQNEPTDSERQIFKVDEFVYYDDSQQFNHEMYEFHAGIDFAMGKEKGDFSAIATVAKNKLTGVCYVLDIFAERLHPKEFIDVIIQKVAKYQYDGIAIESQMAQEFFADTLRDRLQEIGYPAHRRINPIRQRARKELRIEAMSPDTQNGKIRFSRKHTELLMQYERYPMVSHDDMVDAVEMAYGNATGFSMATISSLGSYYSKSSVSTRQESKQERLIEFSRRFRRG